MIHSARKTLFGFAISSKNTNPTSMSGRYRDGFGRNGRFNWLGRLVWFVWLDDAAGSRRNEFFRKAGFGRVYSTGDSFYCAAGGDYNGSHASG